MRKIPLRRRDGSVAAHALVDDADHEELSRYRWHLNDAGYAKRSERVDGRCRTVRMHQHLLGVPLVDHEDGDRLNNQRSNLRPATRSQNGQNRHGLNRNNSSGLRGVSRNVRDGKFWSYCRVDGVLHHLGRYDTPEEAAEVAAAFRAEHMSFSADAKVAA